LRGFLETEPDFEIVGEAASGLEVGPLVEQLRPDVLIVDLLMPGVDGFEVTKQVAEQWPQTRVIVLSMYSNEASVQKAFASGAVGYALKDSTATDRAISSKTDRQDRNHNHVRMSCEKCGSSGGAQSHQPGAAV